jgi:hypothetical protein
VRRRAACRRLALEAQLRHFLDDWLPQCACIAHHATYKPQHADCEAQRAAYNMQRTPRLSSTRHGAQQRTNCSLSRRCTAFPLLALCCPVLQRCSRTVAAAPALVSDHSDCWRRCGACVRACVACMFGRSVALGGFALEPLQFLRIAAYVLSARGLSPPPFSYSPSSHPHRHVPPRMDRRLRSYGYAEQPARPEANANAMQDSGTWSALPSRGASQKRKSVRQRRRPSVVLSVAKPGDRCRASIASGGKT